MARLNLLRMVVATSPSTRWATNLDLGGIREDSERVVNRSGKRCRIHRRELQGFGWPRLYEGNAFRLARATTSMDMRAPATQTLK